MKALHPPLIFLKLIFQQSFEKKGREGEKGIKKHAPNALIFSDIHRK